MRARLRRVRLRRPVGAITVVVTVGPRQRRFLAECGESLAAQSYPSVRVIEVEWTSDLAGARNEGMAAADGAFVLFLEASDTLPRDALAHLAHELAGSTHGMAAGTSQRVDESWRDRAFRPAPGDDLSLANRLIDREAWIAAGLSFDPAHGRWPVAVLARAERQLGTARLALAVHEDRDRAAGLPFGHLVPWAEEAQQWALAHRGALAELGDEPLASRFAAAALDRLRLLEDCAGFGDEDWAAVGAVCAELLGRADLDGVRMEARVGAELAASGRRADLAAWTEQRWRAEPDLPTAVEKGVVVSAVRVPDLPPRLLQLSPRETPLLVSARRLRQDAAGVHLELIALVRGVDPHEPPAVEVTLRQGDRRVPLDVTVAGGPEGAKVAADAHHDYPHSRLLVSLPDDRVPGRGQWRMWVRMSTAGVTREGVVHERDHRAGPALPLRREVGSRELRVRWRDGALEVATGRRRPARPSARQITSIGLVADTLVVRGVGAPAGRLVLQGPAASTSAEATRDGDGFRAVLPLTHVRFGREGLLPVGDHRLTCEDGSALTLAPELLGDTPTDEFGAHYRVRIRVAPDGVPLVELAAPRGDDQLGPSAQRRLQQWYAEDRPLDPQLAYFQSFTGQHVTDNPLAIQQALAGLRPDIRVHWGVADLTVPVPPDVTPVVIRSPEWYSTLATATWLVTNIELERWFRRRPGQQVLQTWHGNPGKVMGRGLWELMGVREPRVRAELQRRADTWTAMVSPTEEMAAHYRSQFEFDGPVLAVGHPRDDVLVGSHAGRLREEARARLDLGPEQTAVLYAPTWRDELATNYRAGRMPEHLDLEATSAALGEDHVVLVRGHRFHRGVRTSGARVLDVTDHPEVNELILAADVGIFDYSSMRFDFGLTGKPMVFLVPDLDTYSTGRGFLYPFEESAPGPLLTNTAEVVAAVQDLPAIEEEYADARARFVARFHAEQDEHSSERVVRAFFGPA